MTPVWLWPTDLSIFLFLFVCLFVFRLCLGWLAVRSKDPVLCRCLWDVDDVLAVPNVKHHWPQPARGALTTGTERKLDLDLDLT